MSEVMEASHKASMNLRFVEREIDGRKIRILQQMFVPKDWSKPGAEEFWLDVPLHESA